MILEMLAADQGGPATQADCARGRLRQKLPELKRALDVETDDAFRWTLSRLLFKLDWLDKEIADLDTRFAAISRAQQDVIRRLCTIPGVDRITAEIIVSELGLDMTQYLLIRDGGVYREKGGDHFDRRDPQRTARKLSKRLERIGYTVTLVRNSPDDFLPKKSPQPNLPTAIVPAERCGRCHDACRPVCFHLLKRPGRRKEQI